MNIKQVYLDKEEVAIGSYPYSQLQQNTLGKRSSLDEALDITAKAIDELSNRLNLLTEKLSPICLPMISDSPRDEERQPSSPVVNRMFAHLKLIDKINRDVNLLLNSLDI